MDDKETTNKEEQITDVILNDKEKNMLLNALEFFVDFRFLTGPKITGRYVEMHNEIDQNDYAILCRKMGGTTKWPPTIKEEGEQ